MSREIEILQKLEKELNLKQLQIKSLLNITQAINDNVKVDGLYAMYESFLAWEMGVSKMVLYLNTEDQWICPSQIKINGNELLKQGIMDKLLDIKRLTTVKPSEFPELKDFDIIIPVYHKSHPLSYALIGGIRTNEDLYDMLQFITTITNIITVAIENKRLFKQQLEKEKYQKEIQLASEVQEMLIPDTIPSAEAYDIARIYKPHYNVGGDYVDFIHLPKGEFLLCMADVSGKGVGAALLMANFQAVIRSLVNKYKNLENLIQEINTSVYNITKGDKFVTCFIAKVNPKKRKISYINAGHFPPFWVNSNEISRLKEGTTIVGAFEELPVVEKGELYYEEESTLMIFTDGLTDIVNDRGDYFDDEEISAFLQEHWQKPAAEINTELEKKMKVFKGKREYPDDIAVLSCKLKANK